MSPENELKWAYAEIQRLQAELDKANRALQTVRTTKDNVWFWQGDGKDEPESLTCPVVMEAETLLKLIGR